MRKEALWHERRRGGTELIEEALSVPGTVLTPGLLRAEQVRRTYVRGKEEVRASENITLSVKKGDFVCIVGTSGCRTTTLLKCVCHLLKPTSGKVFANEREIQSPPKEMSLIFQDYSRSPFPWRTVLKNILFVPGVGFGDDIFLMRVRGL